MQLLAVLPEGSTELMCHPGRCGDALRNARTRLKESREDELKALVAPEVRAGPRPERHRAGELLRSCVRDRPGLPVDA